MVSIRLHLLCLLPSLLISNQAVAAPKPFPCDPKFGRSGNYVEIEISTETIPRGGGGVQLCFGPKTVPRTTHSHDHTGASIHEVQANAHGPSHSGESIHEMRNLHEPGHSEGWSPLLHGKMPNCLRLAELPFRQKVGGQWSAWATDNSHILRPGITQFALCGNADDPTIWEDFHRPLGTDAWDSLRLRMEGSGSVHIDKVRVVQNRVRILDNERYDEGHLDLILGDQGVAEIDLSKRILTTKLNRPSCLNLNPGPPYCEEAVVELSLANLPPHLAFALAELGHSGSAKYGRENVAWCTEFVMFIVTHATNLTAQCPAKIPAPKKADISARRIFEWLSSCARIIPRERLQAELRPGDYLSVSGRRHSVLFLGWADSNRRYFWEISGNNQCRPERETLVGKNYKSNMVCISKREFSTSIHRADFGARLTE